MLPEPSAPPHGAAELPRPVTTETRTVRLALIAVAMGFLGFFLLLPLVAVFFEALRGGIGGGGGGDWSPGSFGGSGGDWGGGGGRF